VDAIETHENEINVGGPEIMTWKQIASLALETFDKPVKITLIPIWIMNIIQYVTRIFSPHKAGLLEFFITMATQDMVGPTTGTHTLRAHYQKMGHSYEI